MELSKKSLNLDLSALAAWKKNPSVVFSILLVILLVFEILVIKNSLSLLSTLNAPLPEAPKSQGVRIKIDAYNQVVKRIQAAKTFQPTGEPAANPFFGASSIPTGH